MVFWLICGTTSGQFSFILQADELSMTVIPCRANWGAHSEEISPPAEKRAKSTSKVKTSSKVVNTYSSPLYFITFPLLASLATRYNFSMFTFLSLSTSSIVRPTMPVAPTIASFIMCV